MAVLLPTQAWHDVPTHDVVTTTTSSDISLDIARRLDTDSVFIGRSHSEGTGIPFTSRDRRAVQAVYDAYDELITFTMFLILVTLDGFNSTRGGPYRQPPPALRGAEPRLGRSGGSPQPNAWLNTSHQELRLCDAIDPDGAIVRVALPNIARRHGVALHPRYVADYRLAQLAAWLVYYAGRAQHRRLRLCHPSDEGSHCHARHAAMLAGAVGWLACTGLPILRRTPALLAGDWRVADICSKWSLQVARELASFSWPIATEAEVRRLLTLPHAAPVAIMGCEFTAATREPYCRHHRRVALSVDQRTSLVPGPHATVDLRLVLMLCVWDDALLFPPCTHQTVSDHRTSDAKRFDGRTFWGIAFFIYCWCVRAKRVLVEQPRTLISDFYLLPSQTIRPCDVDAAVARGGDVHGADGDNKPICLYERGRLAIPQVYDQRVGISGHGQLRDFVNAEARDRWRSSWARFPHLSEAVILGGLRGEGVDPAHAPVYAVEIERFAAAWYDSGASVPFDYASPQAEPTEAHARLYQSVRGRGDGRRIHGVVPTSRRGPTPAHACAVPVAGIVTHPPSCGAVDAPLTHPPGCGAVNACPVGACLAAGIDRVAGRIPHEAGLNAISGPSWPEACRRRGAARGGDNEAPRGSTPSPLAATPGSSTVGHAATVSSSDDGANVLADVGDALLDDADALAGGDIIDPIHLAADFALDASQLTASCVVLVMVAIQAVPLVLAYLDGYRVIGFDLAVRREHALVAAERLSEALIVGTGRTTFTAGRLDDGRGATIFTSPVAFMPPPQHVARTANRRHRLRTAGLAVAWMTLGALAGTPAGAVASCAAWACSALSTEVGALPTAALPGMGGVFRFGVTAVSSLIDRPTLPLAPTAADSLLMRSIQESSLLRSILLETQDSYFADWASRIQPPEMAEFPIGLLSSVSSFTDARFGDLSLPRVRPPPNRARTPLQPQQLPNSRCPRSAVDLMPGNVWARVSAWLQATADDLVCIRDHGDACERKRPRVLVIGQADLHPWARGIVWDFRASPDECGRPLDTRAALQHTLNVDYFRRRLADWPNQHILGVIEDGVTYEADVELQTVLVPHLMSLSKGYDSVVKELNRMASPELQWYTYHADFPFWPMYSLGEGCVPRKLEDRWRRCEEGGGPRKECFDSGGVRALSLNEASKTHHMPQHYVDDRRPEWLAYLVARRLPATPAMIAAAVANRGSKWPAQYMPDLGDVMRILTVLKNAAHRMGESIYIFGDDVKDYFNHLVNAAEERWKINTIFLDGGAHLDEATFAAHDGSTLAFVHERRMGFGLHPNSNIAQEFSDTLIHLFRRDVDAVEDPLLEADPRPEAQAWLEQRRRVEAKHGGHQRRLYGALIYCDDNIVIVVGAARALRLLRQWRALVTDAGLIMAIPEKRSLGVWGIWIGALIFATAGVVAIPKQKTLRATQVIRQLLGPQGVEFGHYRSLIGLLEHLRCITRLPRRAMHGLYVPHGADGESRDGPNAAVHPSLLMSVQLQRWLDVLGRCSGTCVTAVIRRFEWADKAVVRYFVASSDAATDSDPPGMGGFMHGFWWRIELLAVHIQWLHITVLELLATCFSVILFEPLVPPPGRLLMQMDATAAFYTLADETERSPVLMHVHHEALASRAFSRSADRIDVGHLGGDGNKAGDAASRSEDTLLAAFARQARVRLIRLSATVECERILASALAFAQRRGQPVRSNSGRPPAPPMPMGLNRLLTLLERALGSKRRDNDMSDGPSGMESLMSGANRAIDGSSRVEDILAGVKRAIDGGALADDVAFIAVARPLLDALGSERPEVNTFRALYAVLTRDTSDTNRVTCQKRDIALRTHINA